MYLEILMTQFEHIIVASIILSLLHVLVLSRYFYYKRDVKKEAAYFKKVFMKFFGPIKR
jgi:hypothetical protein